MAQGYIYKIINSINNKVYIGKTVQTIHERWLQHQSAYRVKHGYHPALHYAFDKYGIDNFTIVTVECIKADNKTLLEQQLNLREKYWIKYYDSYENGYNCTVGGDGGKTSLKPTNISRVAQIDKKTNQIIHIFESMKSAGLAVNNNEQSAMNISACCRGKQKTAYGYKWAYVNDIGEVDTTFLNQVENNRKKQVVQFSIPDLKMIQIFDSVASAAESIDGIREGTTSSRIATCCRNKEYSARGYQWRYLIDIKEDDE